MYWVVFNLYTLHQSELIGGLVAHKGEVPLPHTINTHLSGQTLGDGRRLEFWVHLICWPYSYNFLKKYCQPFNTAYTGAR